MIRVIITPHVSVGKCHGCGEQCEHGTIVLDGTAQPWHPRCWNKLEYDIRVHASDHAHRCRGCGSKIQDYDWQISQGWKTPATTMSIERFHVECWNNQGGKTFLSEVKFTPAEDEKLTYLSSNGLHQLQQVPKPSETSSPGEASEPDPWPLDRPPQVNGGDLSIDAGDLELEIWEVFSGEITQRPV